MGQVDTLYVGRYMYWSEVLCCTITAHLRDLEVKLMGQDFNRFSDKAQVSELRCPATALISSNGALRSSDRTSYRIVLIRIVHDEIKLHLDDNK